MICDYIQKCLDNCIYDLPDFLQINITGGGFNYIRGIKPTLEAKLKRKVNLVAPKFPNINGPDFSSEVGLLYLALKGDSLLQSMLEI